ncbi:MULTISPECIES: DUF2850 domain-containing protein [Vibrio]|uniref:DUF2850 domain-containing protein n=1 Tax=Vibrio TaxID=662 RepID=UPI002E37F435|nr:DUF2850 domain-containing protein [Vibrio nitrifigilis]
MAKDKKKIVEWSLLTFALVGTICVAVLYGFLYHKAQSALSPKKSIIGDWVEQNVAHYAAMTIEIRKNAIVIHGHTVTTDYDFDGVYLSYEVGGIEYKYKMADNSNTEMKLITPSYYNPVYRLSGKYKNNIR